MLRKIVTGTLVLIVLGASSTVIYANPGDTSEQDSPVEFNINEQKKESVEIFKPQINSQGEVVVDKNLLISVQVLTESSVTMSVYKVLEESEELLFDPEVIKPGENISVYSKVVKDIEPGNYKMTFKNDDEEDVIDPVEFKVKKAEEVVKEEKKSTVSNILDKSVTDLLLGE